MVLAEPGVAPGMGHGQQAPRAGHVADGQLHLRQLEPHPDGVRILGAVRPAVHRIRGPQQAVGGREVAAVAVQQREVGPGEPERSARRPVLVDPPVEDPAVHPLGGRQVTEVVQDPGEDGERANGRRMGVAVPPGAVHDERRRDPLRSREVSQLTEHLGQHAAGGGARETVVAGLAQGGEQLVAGRLELAPLLPVGRSCQPVGEFHPAVLAHSAKPRAEHDPAKGSIFTG
jgi:hypothetical protein